MSFPAFNTFQPRAFIFSSNEESALLVQGTGPKTTIALINSIAQSNLSTIYNITAQNDVLTINKNSNLIIQLNYQNNNGYLSTDNLNINRISFSNSLNFTYSNNSFLIQQNNTPFFSLIQSSSNILCGIGISNPSFSLDVQGNINSRGTIFASKIVTSSIDPSIIYGITSNLNRVIITNSSNGPALSVTQFNNSNVVEYYNNSNLALLINKDGLVGINTTTPRERLDVLGNILLTGSLGIGTTLSNNKLSVQGNVNILGNIGIGTTTPSYGLHVYSDVAMGKGLLNNGPYYIQEGWDSASGQHTIQYPRYCVRDNSIGNLNIHVKSTNSLKVGNLYVSFLKQMNSNVDLFSIYTHKTNNLVTLSAESNTSNIRILTDTDCSISWIASGSC